MVGHKAHHPGVQTPRWWGVNLIHTFAVVTQQRAAGCLNRLGEESPVSSPTIQLIHTTKALTTNLYLREQGQCVGGLASTGKRGLDQAVFSLWGGCSWWGVVFVLGVDVGVVVGWCVVAFVGGGVGGSSSTLQSTSNVHTHVPHPHHTLSTHTPKIKSLCGACGSSWVHIHVQGSTSSKNPHRLQSTSKPGR